MQAYDLTVQNIKNPLGLGSRKPMFSYQIRSECRGDAQTAWQIAAASGVALLEGNTPDLWDSGKVAGRDHFGLCYGGKELRSRQKVFWRVRVWDVHQELSAWSEIAWFEMGLLEAADWCAGWIGQGEEEEGDRSAAPAMVSEFNLLHYEGVEKARLYISGLGLYVASINGKAVTDALYEPGESEYDRTVYYATYDVIALLQEGLNVLGVLLGNGQYVNYAVDPVMIDGRGTLSKKHRYQKNDSAFLREGICGSKKLLAQLEVTRKDESFEILTASDEGWKTKESFITFQNWYGGEDYDGIKAVEMKGWDTTAANHSLWVNAKRMDGPAGALRAKEFLPVQIYETWKPESITRLESGNWLIDMGINCAGFPKLKLWNTEAYRGVTIRMYPAEMLTEDGSNVDQGSCTQSFDRTYSCSIMDSYTVSGCGTEVWHPIFCYHGYQYLEVENFPGIPTVDHFEGCAVRLMNRKASSVETDNGILNRINQMTERAIESNMMFSFTDCPQIEKLGWIETTHLMFASVAAGYDIRSWIPKIARDMRDAQVTKSDVMKKGIGHDDRKYPGYDKERLKEYETEEEGFVPGIAPEYFRIGGLYKDPNWGGACIMTPWYYYLEYGDISILSENYSMMQRYIKHLENQAEHGVLLRYAQMGDWGQLREETPAPLVATCAYYLQAVIMTGIAELLQKQEDRDYYRKLAGEIQSGFHEHTTCYVEKKKKNVMDFTYGNDSQASYGCVLFSGILPEKNRKKAVEKLIAAVERRDHHLSSGEVGLKQVFVALAREGKQEVIYRMVMNQTWPSYRFFVEEGLTTLPEYWNYAELWHGSQRSRNHAMMGHVKEWLGCYVLGIRPLEPGYARLQIKPYLQEEVTTVKGGRFTVRGYVTLCCERREHETLMEVTIPCGAKADVYIPWAKGTHEELAISESYEVTADGYVKIANLPSGAYCFHLTKKKEE